MNVKVLLATTLAFLLNVSGVSAQQPQTQPQKQAKPAKTNLHAMVGELRKLDMDAKTMVLKTADGTEHVIRYTENTIMTGAEQGTQMPSLMGEEGAQIVLHYTGQGANMTAHAIERLGRVTMQTMEGTLQDVRMGGREIVLKAADGREEVFEVAERAVMDTSKGIVSASDFMTRKGSRVMVHYTSDGSRKVAQLISDPRAKTTRQ